MHKAALRTGIKAATRVITRVYEFLKSWWQPHRRAALIALIKASSLLGALLELGWLLNTHYFSRRFPQLPISLAWSMLTMIFLTMSAQVGWSIVLKLRNERSNKLREAVNRRCMDLLAGYVSGGNLQNEIKGVAEDSPEEFESSVALVLLGLRGTALQRLCNLPAVSELRLRWIKKARTGGDDDRRHALEQLSLLRDPALIPVLEKSLEDSVAGVVASAVRGLLQMPSYERREELIGSLHTRPYLVRVLTACEAPADLSPPEPRPATIDILAFAQAHGRRKRQTRAVALEVTDSLRVANAEQTGEYEYADLVRAHCSALAGLGSHGRDLLHLMSAVGEAGEAPAEALGELLAAAARGGRG
jgi:hypothetical protein